MIRRFAKRLLYITLAYIPALLVLGTLIQFVSTKIDEQRFPPIGTMVDVGGYKLHMYMTGSGKGPTVVLDSGLGCNCLDWSLVQPELSQSARVVSYDRAGYGWSEESPLPRTSHNIATELHTLLHNANVPGPYLLVGHSFGGLNLRMFAQEYPEEVAGIVLVDAAHEELLKKMPPFPHTLLQKCLLHPTVKQFLATIGATRLFNTFTNAQNGYDGFPESVRVMYSAVASTLKFTRAQSQEFIGYATSAEEVKQLPRYLGNKPIIVITAGKPPRVEDTGFSKEFLLQAKGAWDELQSDLMNKSARAKQVFAEESGHMVNHEQPNIIVDSVRELLRN